MSIPVSGQTPDRVPEPLARMVELMSTFRSRWSLCGGWAVDSWLGRQTREHHDIDIAVFEDDLDAVFDDFAGWQLIAHDDLAPDDTEPWTGRLLVLPAHIHARHPDFELDIQVNERSGDDWVLSHEHGIAMDLRRCDEKSGWGLPTLVPEVILFYKARDARPQDEADFGALLPHLGGEQINWLREAIVRVQPGHPWLPQLSR